MCGKCISIIGQVRSCSDKRQQNLLFSHFSGKSCANRVVKKPVDDHPGMSEMTSVPTRIVKEMGRWIPAEVSNEINKYFSSMSDKINQVLYPEQHDLSDSDLNMWSYDHYQRNVYRRCTRNQESYCTSVLTPPAGQQETAVEDDIWACSSQFYRCKINH